MQVLHTLSQHISKQPTVLTIGMFDGMHLGHQRLIRSVVESAHATGRHAALVTFFPHPGVVLGHAKPFYITSTEEKLAQLERLGLDIVVVVEFTPETTHIRADQFVNLLVENLNMREMWIGYDFALGYQREGNQAFLRARGIERGFTVHAITEPVLFAGQPISSSRIRAALRAGDIRQANACLGRPFQVSGSVFQGERWRRKPEARAVEVMVWNDHALPLPGYYVCRAHVNDTIYAVVARITQLVHDYDKRVIELDLPDFVGNLDGQTVMLDLIECQPSEEKVQIIQSPIAQMQQRCVLLPSSCTPQPQPNH